MTRPQYSSVDSYIASLPAQAQPVVKELRTHLRNLVPQADEVISYNIPCLKVDGKYLIYYAGYSSHIGIYPIQTTDQELLKELEPYRSGKATIRFELGKSLPYDLIDKLIQDKLATPDIA